MVSMGLLVNFSSREEGPTLTLACVVLSGTWPTLSACKINHFLVCIRSPLATCFKWWHASRWFSLLNRHYLTAEGIDHSLEVLIVSDDGKLPKWPFQIWEHLWTFINFVQPSPFKPLFSFVSNATAISQPGSSPLCCRTFVTKKAGITWQRPGGISSFNLLGKFGLVEAISSV